MSSSFQFSLTLPIPVFTPSVSPSRVRRRSVMEEDDIDIEAHFTKRNRSNSFVGSFDPHGAEFSISYGHQSEPFSPILNRQSNSINLNLPRNFEIALPITTTPPLVGCASNLETSPTKINKSRKNSSPSLLRSKSASHLAANARYLHPPSPSLPAPAQSLNPDGSLSVISLLNNLKMDDSMPPSPLWTTNRHPPVVLMAQNDDEKADDDHPNVRLGWKITIDTVEHCSPSDPSSPSLSLAKSKGSMDFSSTSPHRMEQTYASELSDAFFDIPDILLDASLNIVRQYIQISPKDSALLALAWECDAHLRTITQTDLQSYFTKTHINSPQDLLLHLDTLQRNLLTASRSDFRPFFQFAFRFMRPSEASRSMPLLLASQILRLLLLEKYPMQMRPFLRYLCHLHTSEPLTHYISNDQWCSVLDWCDIMDPPSYSQYDDEGCWPVLFDEYMKWLADNDPNINLTKKEKMRMNFVTRTSSTASTTTPFCISPEFRSGIMWKSINPSDLNSEEVSVILNEGCQSLDEDF